MKTIYVWPLLALSIALASCGHWGQDKYDARVVDAVDAKLQTGMSIADLQAVFPDAQQVDDDTWFVVADELCFRCTNARAFKRSRDFYARIVKFENGRLSAIEAVQEGGSP